MTQFKVGDRVRLKERYGSATVGTEGTVVRVDGNLLEVDSLAPLHSGIYAGRFDLIEPKDAPRVGDVVRVVLEGKVTYVSGRGFDVADENTIPHSGAEHVKSVEIIKPAKPSAADLPVPSVVKADGSVFQKRGHDTWATIGEDYRTRDLDLDIMGWTLLVEQASE